MSNRTKIVKIDNDPQGFNYVIEFPEAFKDTFDDYKYEVIQCHCEMIIAMLITDLCTGKTDQFFKMNDLFYVKKMEEIHITKKFFLY